MKTLHYTVQICESGNYSSWSSMLVTLISNDHAQTVTADSANSYKQNQIEQHYFWARNEVAPVRTRNTFMLIYKSGGVSSLRERRQRPVLIIQIQESPQILTQRWELIQCTHLDYRFSGGGAYWFVSWKMIAVSEPEETLEEWTSSIETGWTSLQPAGKH